MMLKILSSFVFIYNNNRNYSSLVILKYVSILTIWKNVTKNSLFSIKWRKVFESFCLLTHPLKLHFEKELNSCIYSCTQKFWTKNGFEVRMRKISISFNLYFGWRLKLGWFFMNNKVWIKLLWIYFCGTRIVNHIEVLITMELTNI